MQASTAIKRYIDGLVEVGLLRHQGAFSPLPLVRDIQLVREEIRSNHPGLAEACEDLADAILDDLTSR